MKNSEELRKYIESLPEEEQEQAMKRELNSLLEETNKKIAEAKRLIEPDYLDDEKIKEHIVEKSKSGILHYIMIVLLIFIVPTMAIKLENYIEMSDLMLMVLFIIIGFLFWIPMKFLYYVPREKRFKEFAEQNWHRSVMFESRWDKIQKVSTKRGMEYFVRFFDDNGKRVKVEIQKQQYDSYSMMHGEKILYLLKCPKYNGKYAYVPLCPLDFENKSSLKIV